MPQNKLILDGTKLRWHTERVKDWLAGKRIAPITVDMALTQACNYKCVYCYGQLQKNSQPAPITLSVMKAFFDDCAEIGVKAVSLVSDGESTCNPCWVDAIMAGSKRGLDMALGTNGYLINSQNLKAILQRLTYLRFNISAGEPRRYAEIMGVSEAHYEKVIYNIKLAVLLKKIFQWPVTIGMQMVLMPQFADQIIPLAKLAVELKVDYLVIKHCSDDENNTLGVNYGQYGALETILQEAEALSNDNTAIVVKWNKLRAGNERCYRACYGPPFIIQVSGTGLVAPCGMLFAERYKDYHIGNITQERFKTIWKSERYWEVMRRLASEEFDARTMCGCLCLQHHVNEFLDGLVKGAGELVAPTDYYENNIPQHINYI